MAHFKRLTNSYIYLYHWIDGTDSFKISTKMKVVEDDWNENKQRPKNSKALCMDKLITWLLEEKILCSAETMMQQRMPR
jgi:hypothetical protein